MSNFVSVIFCRNCGSRYVDISQWSSSNKPVFQCRTCGVNEEVGNFTLGHGQVTNKELNNARESIARKNKYER